MPIKNNNRKDVVLKNAYTDIRYKQNKKWGLAGVISFGLFKELIYKPCVYCCATPNKALYDWSHGKNRVKISSASITVSGIDRIDSTKGYVEGNVVPCCALCNFAKSDMPLSEFEEWVKRAHNHLFKDEEA